MAYASPPYYGYPEGTSTPSPLAGHGFYQPAPSPRHYSHSRHTSHDYGRGSPGASYPSPRYSSSGRYSTRTGVASPSPFAEAEYVSYKTRKPHHTYHKHGQSWSFPNPRFTHSYRASYGDSDEDELIEIDGPIYIIPGGRSAKTTYYRGRGTNHYYPQGFTYDRDGTPVIIAEPTTPRYDETPLRRSRRASVSTPQRPGTAPPRPMSSSKKQAFFIPKATDADARAHHIPPGYSLKNWDPTEEPIMLLGSVFDANSLGKWIYDWTVYRHGPATPISDVAGELWLLLIQLAGKVKRSEECMPRIRSEDNRLMINDFIESGERLMDKLKKLLKSCEGPMLKAARRLSSKEPSQLGKNSGIEFVDSIFGRDRQLDHTEKFMASIRLWNLRFDANCEDILLHPTA